MLKTRLWRIGTAAVAVSALLMTTVGGATAQTEPIEDLLDPGQLDQLGDLLGDDDDGEGDGLTGTPLDTVLDLLDLDDLDELLGLLEGGLPGDDDADDGDDSEPAESPDTTGDDADVPGTDIGGFVGEASAIGLSVGVGLPGELAEPLAPVLDALGIAGGDGIQVNIAETTAQLQRAAEGEDVDGLAEALIANLLLGSGAADKPGACQGGDTVNLPDDETPVIRVTVADIDCDQDDERAFAKAHVAGVSVNLGNLIDIAGAEDLREGLDELLEPVNEQLLGAINDACGEVLVPVGSGLEALPILNLDGAQLCDAINLNLENVLNVDVPLLDVDLLESTSEVTHDGDTVTATATSGLAQLQLAGLVCVEGPEPGQALEFVSTATSDGEVGSASTQAPETTVRLCGNSPLAQILDAEALLNSIEIAGQGAAEIVDGTGEITSNLTMALETLAVDTERSLSTDSNIIEDGAGAAANARLDVLGLRLFNGIEPLADTSLGDITVNVTAMDTSAGVNAEPEGPMPTPAGPDPDPAPAPEPDEDLPVTGASAALLGLGAMGLAVAMRRREDEE
jgi:hypothetical protein